MPGLYASNLFSLLKYIRDINLFPCGTATMALKRNFSTSPHHRASKRLKVAHAPNYHERQWEVVYEPSEESSADWFKFTMASYNILAQNLLENTRHLYKKCQSRHLSWNHRKSLIHEELAYHQPDILCLQEVQFREYSRFFLPELQKLGYFGLYKKRTSEKEDGCATFFKLDKFTCLSSRAMEFRDKGTEGLNRDNVGLILLLKPAIKKGRNGGVADERLKDVRVCVANTHLLFNPKRGDIKLFQLMSLLAGIDDVTDGLKHPVLICGDFNSHPSSGVYNFLVSGRLDVRDVNPRFFSGQLKPSAAAVDEPAEDAAGSRTFRVGPSLSPSFLDDSKLLTDQCQFVDVVRRRALDGDRNLSKKLQGVGGSRRKWKPETKEEDDCDDSSSLTDYISWSGSPSSYTQGSGLITHRMNLNSVYDHERSPGGGGKEKQVSCFLENNCNTVDFIFYSNSVSSERRASRSSEEEEDPVADVDLSVLPSKSDLHPLRRFRLFTESQIKSHYNCMPNADLGSDHTILICEFGIRL